MLPYHATQPLLISLFNVFYDKKEYTIPSTKMQSNTSV